MQTISRSLRRTLDYLSRWDRLVLAQVVLWAAAMVSLPVLYWTFDQEILQTGIEIGVLLQVAAVMVILAHSWGVWPALRLGLLVFLLALAFEAAGTRLGYPFGGYDYTPLLQPQVLSVPLLVPLAWLMMLPPAWALGWLLVSPSNRLLWALASALAFTTWDLFLDPQMVAWDYWHWHQSGAYFGIPLTNYLGWLVVSFLISLVASAFFHPASLPVSPLLVVYILIWLLQFISLFFFWGLPGPALVGYLCMGTLLALAWLRNRKKPASG